MRTDLIITRTTVIKDRVYVYYELRTVISIGLECKQLGELSLPIAQYSLFLSTCQSLYRSYLQSTFFYRFVTIIITTKSVTRDARAVTETVNA